MRLLRLVMLWACLPSLIVAILAAAPARAAEVRVLNANALTIALRAIAAEHTKATGDVAAFTFGSPGAIQKRIDDGETYDLLIMPTPALAALEAAGKLTAGTRRPLVRVGIGVAMREGAPRPDISTPEALRRMLLAQAKVTYSDASTGGLSGINALKVLQQLGIAEEIKPRLLPHANGQELIGRGEADLGLYNVSEIPRAKGVVLLGPVPAAVQVYITYDVAVPASNAAPAAALALVRAIAAPAAAPTWTAAGLEQAAP